jgi:hypothetical protein
MARILREMFRIIRAWYLVCFGKDKRPKERMKVCYECPNRKYFVCGLCGCPLIALTQLSDGCELKKWPV